MPADRPLRLTSELIEAILGRMIVMLYAKIMLAQLDICSKTACRDLPSQFPKEQAKDSALAEGDHLDGVLPRFSSELRQDRKLVSQFSVDLVRVTRLLSKLQNQFGEIGVKQEIDSLESYSEPDLNSADRQSKAEETVDGEEDKILCEQTASTCGATDQHLISQTSAESESWSGEGDIILDKPIGDKAIPLNLQTSLNECLEFLQHGSIDADSLNCPIAHGRKGNVALPPSFQLAELRIIALLLIGRSTIW